uniref:FMN-linked oxidoreductase n=1 Tax=Mycena chlorophos TaxID=658473 RepID=A0ABQ0MCZ7_MYCCL|nr:FMN-linked oxidoreductase [Mycena chlorophos]
MPNEPIFSSIQLPCGRQVRNRLVKAALYEHLATLHGGPPNELHLRLYEQWAASEWGMIITGNVQVSPTHLSLGRDIVLPPNNDEKHVAPFRALANAIHGHGDPQPLAILQLSHAGRQSPNILGGRRPFEAPLGPSAVRVGEGVVSRAVHAFMFQTPLRMRLRDIEKAIAEFVRGAQLAEEAGFDGVELHAAHGYLIAQFLSPKSNKRTGNLGPDETLWFLFRIVHGIRLVVSPTFILGIKLNSTDSGVDALKHVQTIASWARVDFIEVSGGDYESPDFLLEKSSRQALFADFSTRARESLASLPPEKRPLVLLTGGLSKPAQLRNALAAGHADLVGLGRTAVLCPDAPSRIRNNRPFPAQPTLDFHPLLAWLPFPRIKLIGAGTTMAWYTVMLRGLAQGREVDFGMGPVGGLVWMWFWMGPRPDSGWKRFGRSAWIWVCFGVLLSALMLRLWVLRS